MIWKILKQKNRPTERQRLLLAIDRVWLRLEVGVIFGPSVAFRGKDEP